MNVREIRYAIDSRIQVELYDQGTIVSKHFINGDWHPGLVEVVWPEHAQGAGVLLCNRSGPEYFLEVDLHLKRITVSRRYTKQVLEQIRTKYDLPNEADVLVWACSDNGIEAYRARLRN